MATTWTGASQTVLWKKWYTYDYGTAGSMSTTANLIWRDWQVPTATTTTEPILINTGNVTYTWRDDWIEGTQDYVWRDWNNNWRISQRTFVPQAPVETPEARQERLDREQRAREERSARELAARTQLAKAEDRARELLMMLLSNEEAEWLTRHKEIMVRSDGGRMYVIEDRGAVHGNIREVDEHGCVLGRVCVQPRMYDDEANAAIPISDGIVGQYLAIKHNEEELRRTGNWSHRQPCKQPGVPILGQRAA